MRHHACVSKAVQIRDVDDQTYATLRARAASEGMSLGSYLRRELHRLASGPNMTDWVCRSVNRSWGVDRESALEALREERDGNG